MSEREAEGKWAPRNGWVIVRDGIEDEVRNYWTGEDVFFTDDLSKAVFFATEVDAETVAAKVLPHVDTRVEWVHDPRPDSAKMSTRQTGKPA